MKFPKWLLLVGSVALAVLAAGIAMAVPSASLSVQLTPREPGTATRPTNTKLHVVSLLSTETPAEEPPTTAAIKLFLPSELRIGGKAFGVCDASQLSKRAGECPDKSRVGAGSADVTVFAGGRHAVPAQVTAYNSAGGKSLLLHLEGSNGFITLNDVIAGRFSNAGKPGFGKKVSLVVPPTLRHPGGGRATVSRLDITLSGIAKVRRPGRPAKQVPYVGLGRCPDKKLAFESDTTFEEPVAPVADNVTLRCS